jgi:hypothetical protein
MTMIEPDLKKLNELYELANIPTNMGEQFIRVTLNLTRSLKSGTIYFGLDFKMEMGEMEFRNLDEAIEKVEKLRRRATM